MRRILGFLVVLLLLLPMSLKGQDASGPEPSALDVLVGEWTFTWANGTGTWSCDKLGDSFVLCDAHLTFSSGVESRLIDIWGIDTNSGRYTWDRFLDSGVSESGQGWIRGDTWSYVFLDPAGTVSRMTAEWTSSDEFAYRWHTSVEGGPWEDAGEGVMTRVK